MKKEDEPTDTAAPTDFGDEEESPGPVGPVSDIVDDEEDDIPPWTLPLSSGQHSIMRKMRKSSRERERKRERERERERKREGIEPKYGLAALGKI